MPELGRTESAEATRTHSAALLLAPHERRVRHAPMRAPHFTTSMRAMTGSTSAPGELALCHHGILYLDDPAELTAEIVNAIRHAAADCTVFHTDHRNNRRITRHPSRFMLIVADPKDDSQSRPVGHHKLVECCGIRMHASSKASGKRATLTEAAKPRQESPRAAQGETRTVSEARPDRDRARPGRDREDHRGTRRHRHGLGEAPGRRRNDQRDGAAPAERQGLTQTDPSPLQSGVESEGIPETERPDANENGTAERARRRAREVAGRRNGTTPDRKGIDRRDRAGTSRELPTASRMGRTSWTPTSGVDLTSRSCRRPTSKR